MRDRTRWLAIASIGFGLVLSLNAFTLWGISDLLSPASRWPWAAGTMGAFCLPANVLAFLAWGLLGMRSARLSQHRPTAATCVLLVTGGAALLAACLAGEPALPLFQLAGVLLGAGGAMAFICWELTFWTGTVNEARAAILLASVFSTVPYLMLKFLFSSDTLVYPLVGVLVPCCVLLLVVAARLTPEPGAQASCTTTDAALSTQAAEARPVWRSLWSDLWAPLACTMMVGVIGPAIGSFATLGTMSDALRSLLYQFANILAAGVLALCWFRFKKHPSIELSFLVLVPIAVVVLFLFPFWQHGYQGFVLMFGCFIFSLVSILMMMTCIELAHRHRVGIGAVYGLFAAGTYLAQIIGGTIAGIVGTSAYPRQFQVVAMVVLLLWGLSALGFVAMWRMRPAGWRRGRGGQEGMPGAAWTARIAVENAEDGRGTTGALAGDVRQTGNVRGPGEAAEQAEASDTLVARCEALRDQFALTPREVEVLELIGRGRDVGAIAEILGLSRNTVRTHVQRLYADLDVHTRQELIDLLERTAGAGR